MRASSLPGAYAPLLRHLEAEYPREGCGLILGVSLEGPWRLHPMRNAVEASRAATAYAFEPREWLVVNREADARGERILCVYHSHVDTEAYFSSEDREWAAPHGAPVLPGVSYLVVSVRSGRAEVARMYMWDGVDFVSSYAFPGFQK